MLSYSTYDDKQLLGLLTENDENAFSEIYNRYWKPLYHSAHTILHDTSPAQDAVQEIFITLWQRRHSVDIDNLKAYLFQAIRFRVFKAIRAGKAQASFYDRLAAVSREILQQDPLLYKEMQQLIVNTIDALPEDQREIFLLHRTEGLTYNEIAEKKNISVKTVEKKMSLALKHLRINSRDAILLLLLFKV